MEKRNQGCRKPGGWGVFSPIVFGITVNPISTKGTDYAHHSTTSPSGFSNLALEIEGGPSSESKYVMEK